MGQRGGGLPGLGLFALLTLAKLLSFCENVLHAHVCTNHHFSPQDSKDTLNFVFFCYSEFYGKADLQANNFSTSPLSQL